MAKILKHDTDGTKSLLGKGEFGYDDYPAGGDAGRVSVGTGTENIPLGTKAEIEAVQTNLNNKPNTPSTVASSVLLSGDVALANSVITKNFAVVTYTGNGTSQSITTGISSVDFTVSGNGSGYYHDRVAGDCIVKNDAGTIVESGSCVCNVSQVHIKARSSAYANQTYDGLRGTGEYLITDQTLAENTTTTGLTSFNTTGFNVSSLIGVNGSGTTFVAYQTLYTHIRWGLTNQNKRYIEAYNPITGDTMIMYEGSGVAGHQIPHSLGRKLDFFTVRPLNQVNDWAVFYGDETDWLILNNTNAAIDNNIIWNDTSPTSTDVTLGTANVTNGNYNYILYGKAKSTTWTIVQYQGTGASGNFVETKDVYGVARKPRRVIIKSTSATGDWVLYDSERDNTGDNTQVLYLNVSNAEVTAGSTTITITSNGFNIPSTGTNINASGGQYIALVEFDTNGDGGDGYFNLPTDDTNLSLNSGTFIYTNGFNGGGYNVTSKEITAPVTIDFNGTSIEPDGSLNTSTTDAVPFMTGYTTPSGVVSASSDLTDADAWEAFAEDETTNTLQWLTDSTTTGWLQYKFDTSKIINKYSLTCGNSITRMANSWTIEASNTGAFSGEEVTLDTVSGETGWSDDEKRYYSFVNATSYLYYRINITANNGDATYIAINNMEFIEAQELPDAPDGVNWLYEDEVTGGFGFSQSRPSQSGLVTSDTGGITRPVLVDGKWYNSTDGVLGTELGAISWFPYPFMVASGTPMYEVIDVEPLADVVANNVEFNQVRANEYKGKNACTAWVNFDGTTTPPTIRDSYNVSDVVRTGTGYFTVYFENSMDNSNYSITSAVAQVANGGTALPYNKANNMFSLYVTISANTSTNTNIDLQVFGGK